MTRNFSTAFERINPEERQALLLPATYIALLVEALIALQFLNMNLDLYQRYTSLIVGLGMIIYTWVLYRFLYPYSEQHVYVRWLLVVVNGVGILLLANSLPPSYNLVVAILALILIASSAILLGRWVTHVLNAILFILSPLLFTDVTRAELLSLALPFSLPLLGIMLNETLYRLGRTVEVKVQRLETINQVARKVAATLDVDQVISLVCEAVQDAVHADTYYVGLLRGDCLRLVLFYDEGEFYDPVEVSLENNLVGWIVKNRKALFFQDLPNEIEKLGSYTQQIGKPKMSLSWMGTPMEAGNQVVGVMAMASYRVAAFSKADLDLLESLAQQAALAIANATHHALVERQTRLDSLTQVYNHRQLLEYLDQQTRWAQNNQLPLSLIMLDIDFFKRYNDTYGHLVGDQALTQVVAAIRQHVRTSDILGRWGGEEFAVILPETNGQQATRVAYRIQQTLRSLTLVTPQGETIPAPTISLGIAILAEVENANDLIDLADRRLYQAKERGRDQVEPEISYWDID